MFLFLFFVAQVDAQITITEEDYARAEATLGTTTRGMVYHTSIQPNWLEDDRFWYLQRKPADNEYMLVDPAQGEHRSLFDEERMTEAINRHLGISGAEVNFSRVSYDGETDRLLSPQGSGNIACSVITYTCESIERTDRENTRRTAAISPDGNYEAFRKDNNLWIRTIDTDEETQLTFDGEKNFGYATNNAGWVRNERPVLLWSPDSKKIATFQHDGRGVGEMYMVSTEIGRSNLEAWKYPLPQDSVVFMIHRVVIHVDEPRTVRLDMAPDYHRGTTTDHIADWDGTFMDVRWSDDSEQLAFVSSSRDHKDAWLRVADPETGAVREVLHERVETYYESGVNAENWQVFFDTGEVLWYSERSNWGHLYLYDLSTGELKHQITDGDWIVRQVRRTDMDARMLYFTGSGRDGPDPYFQYLYRVSMDGGEPELLTPEEANHSVSFSPGGHYILDTWSRPDVPQKHAVRNLDGSIAVNVGEADISELLATGLATARAILSEGAG